MNQFAFINRGIALNQRITPPKALVTLRAEMVAEEMKTTLEQVYANPVVQDNGGGLVTIWDKPVPAA